MRVMGGMELQSRVMVKGGCHPASNILNFSNLGKLRPCPSYFKFQEKRPKTVLSARASGDSTNSSGSPTFLSLEEAGLVEMSGLDMHERFLCRLTISSLNLLRVISEQEGMPIEELNAGRICDWFVKDKAKREKDINSATLKWDSKVDW